MRAHQRRLSMHAHVPPYPVRVGPVCPPRHGARLFYSLGACAM